MSFNQGLVYLWLWERTHTKAIGLPVVVGTIPIPKKDLDLELRFMYHTTMNNIVDKARVFAFAAHNAIGQVRKYTGEPYTVHLEEVVSILKGYTRATGDGTDAMFAAAWLHDVLEDTKVSPDLLRQEFGDEITDLVLWLTDVSKPEDGNRAVRKAKDRLHLAAAPATAQTIKLADLMSNTKSIRQHDPNFAKVYLKEKALLLDLLEKGNPILRVNAYAMVDGRL